ncbi:MAG TPA: Ig-like domain-containing protein, partial [Candidatus Acidoferrum sp.]
MLAAGTTRTSPSRSPAHRAAPPSQTTTEGANQVVSGTATDANGLNATASVTLNIDKTQPVLAGISPADGAVVSSSPVTVSGTVSDALSGLSAATCNGTAATVNGGSFSCNISLNVGVNLVMVRLTDVAGNAAGSNFHVSLSGTLPAPTSLQVSPISVNMLVGDTQQFTAVDQLGRPRSDATWTISNTSLASITTDSSPTLTANAVGTLTLTATVGSKSAQAQVTILSGASLPAGTVRWSAPSTPGFTVQQIVQAVPTANGPDLYSIETDGN